MESKCEYSSIRIPNDRKYATAAAIYVSEIARSIGMQDQDLKSLENGIIEAVKKTLVSCPPELAGDLIDQGITLAGGGALLRGIGAAISDSVGLPCHLADDPLTAVARGTGVFLDNLNEVREILEQAEDD